MSKKPTGEKKEKKEYKKNPVDCMFTSPGPIVYKLPTLVGYTGHDISKYRGPAFTMRKPTNVPNFAVSPGPKYNTYGLGKLGKPFTPRWTLGSRRPPIKGDVVPGPGAYADKSLVPKKRYPAWTMLAKARDMKGDKVPGPIYDIPRPVGTSAYLFGKRKELKPFVTPAPNHYGLFDLNKVKKRAPAGYMGIIKKPAPRPKTPGPLDYLPLLTHLRRAPLPSFGVKHSQCRNMFFTPADNAF